MIPFYGRRRVASQKQERGCGLTGRLWRGSFGAWDFLLRCGALAAWLGGAAGLRARPALSGLAMPAIEGAGDFDRERLDRPADRRHRHDEACRPKASRARRASGRAPHADRGRAEADRGLPGRNQRRETGKGEEAVRRVVFDAQCAARRGDERDRALFAQAEGHGRGNPRANPEDAGTAGSQKTSRRRSGAEQRTRQPACLANAHFRGPAQIDVLCLRRAGPDREAAVRSGQRDPGRHERRPGQTK